MPRNEKQKVLNYNIGDRTDRHVNQRHLIVQTKISLISYLILTVIINKTKYFLPPFARDWLAISAALLITGPKSVGPARETL